MRYKGLKLLLCCYFIQCREEVLFHFEVLHDGLHHQISALHHWRSICARGNILQHLLNKFLSSLWRNHTIDWFVRLQVLKLQVIFSAHTQKTSAGDYNATWPRVYLQTSSSLLSSDCPQCSWWISSGCLQTCPPAQLNVQLPPQPGGWTKATNRIRIKQNSSLGDYSICFEKWSK